MNEYHIQLEIEPETYDYGEEEIVYRIFCDEVKNNFKKEKEQLIIERSLPILSSPQKIIDHFILPPNNIQFNIMLLNLCEKKAKIKSANINGISLLFDNFAHYRDKTNIITIINL